MNTISLLVGTRPQFTKTMCYLRTPSASGTTATVYSLNIKYVFRTFVDIDSKAVQQQVHSLV